MGEELRIPDYTQRMAGVRSWKVAYNLWMWMGGYLWSAANVGPCQSQPLFSPNFVHSHRFCQRVFFCGCSCGSSWGPSCGGGCCVFRSTVLTLAVNDEAVKVGQCRLAEALAPRDVRTRSLAQATSSAVSKTVVYEIPQGRSQKIAVCARISVS